MLGYEKIKLGHETISHQNNIIETYFFLTDNTSCHFLLKEAGKHHHFYCMQTNIAQLFNTYDMAHIVTKTNG